jgi:hypothetical protein
LFDLAFVIAFRVAASEFARMVVSATSARPGGFRIRRIAPSEFVLIGRPVIGAALIQM